MTSNNKKCQGLRNNINITLESIMKWLISNYLHGYLTTTNYIQFLKGTSQLNLNLHYKNELLCRAVADNTLFLGLWLDKNLNYIQS